MTARSRRAVAKRPAPRTIDVELTQGPYAGWWCKARVDFPARLLEDIQSGSVDRMMTALGSLVVEHNFPGADGALAPQLADVDPYDGLVTVIGELADRINKLPPR